MGNQQGNNGTVLIVDDEKAIRRSFIEILSHEGYTIDEAIDGADGHKKLSNNNYDCVICDVKMPKMDGIELLNLTLGNDPTIPFIIVSAHTDVQMAVEAVKSGAYDCVTKPPDLTKLLFMVRDAVNKHRGTTSVTKVQEKKIDKRKPIDEMIGNSPLIEDVRKQINKISKSDARVLILGPNGVGKELVAKSLHRLSNRASGPFIEVNCAAIPGELIESELFGHEKGAFTSAHKQRVGKFELAQGGTLFLDEIGDMSFEAQAKVLRALEESRITRVGGEKDIVVDVRIIAATNKDIKGDADANKFRLDLFHRLGVILINVPSLNKRREDIPLLANYFLEIYCKEYKYKNKKITSEAMQLLTEYNWTGNIRELRNVMERLVILCEDIITGDDVERYVIM